MKRLTVILLFSLLLGDGCLRPLVEIPSVTEPLGKSFKERPIAQFEGFGQLPKTPAPELWPGVKGSVRLEADFPLIPFKVAALRVRQGRPNDTQLRNIANSFDIPGAVLGEQPEGRELGFEWKNEEMIWKADAASRRVEFAWPRPPFAPLSVSAWPDKQKALDRAAAFLQEHGVLIKKYGDRYVSPNWAEWWKTEEQQEKCMDTNAVSAIRGLTDPLAVIEPNLKLPSRRNATCLNPEFPSQMIIRVNATQDGQAILNGDGTARYAASLAYDIVSDQITSGWFRFFVNPDRSDYPALSQNEARSRLSQGGQGGTPNGDVTIKSFTFEWLWVPDQEIGAEYLFPAVVGHGNIKYPNGTEAPHRIVTPLVRD